MFKEKIKKEVNKKTIIIISGIVIIILIMASVRIDRKTTILESALKDISMGVEKVIMYPFVSIKDKNKINVKVEEDAKDKEIAELKDELELKRTMTGFTIINSTILSRNKSYWFNTLTIDKGKSSGIKKDMAVATSKGLVGKISKVYDNASEVKLITSDDVNYKVSVAIKTNNGDCYAILNGYNYKTKKLTITGVDKDASVEVGNDIMTSGIGGVFPSGIKIGKVENIINDKYDLSKTLEIKSDVNFDNIHYVAVLKVQ
jgi:rod shape-determining protein MreC